MPTFLRCFTSHDFNDTFFLLCLVSRSPPFHPPVDPLSSVVARFPAPLAIGVTFYFRSQLLFFSFLFYSGFYIYRKSQQIQSWEIINAPQGSCLLQPLTQEIRKREKRVAYIVHNRWEIYQSLLVLERDEMDLSRLQARTK